MKEGFETRLDDKIYIHHLFFKVPAKKNKTIQSLKIL